MKAMPTSLITEDKIDLLVIARGLPGVKVEARDEMLVLTRKWRVRGAERFHTTVIKRFVNAAKLAMLLGLQRSEGLKDGTRVRFTNTDQRLHQMFIESLKELGINDFSVHAYYCYCERCGLEKLKNAIKEFEELTKIKVKAIYANKNAHKVVFQTDVNDRIVAMLLIRAEELLRKLAAKGLLPREIVTKYILGVLEGDGYVELRLKKSINDDSEKADGLFLRISESNSGVAADLKEIFRRYFGIQLHSHGYDHIGSINLQRALMMLKDDIIPLRHKNKVIKRVLLAFRRKGLPWILVQLAENYRDRWFTAREASKVLVKRYNHAREKLAALEKDGFLASIKCKFSPNGKGTPIKRIYRLTEKAMQIESLLSSLLHTSPTFPFLENLINSYILIGMRIGGIGCQVAQILQKGRTRVVMLVKKRGKLRERMKSIRYAGR